MHRHRVVALMTVVTGVLMGCGMTSRTDADRVESSVAAEVAATLDSLRLAADIPGLAVVMLHDTTVLYAGGFGVADLNSRVPVTDATPFNIASVSKPISAVVALRLVQDGLLDLDQPMQSYVGFAEFCDDVRGVGGIFYGDFECQGDQLTMRHVLSMTANGAPGTRFWYNPPVYSWASRPMAEVSGHAFSDLVDSLIFQPAHMTTSARINRDRPLPDALARALASPHGRDSTGRMVTATLPPPQGDGAAGGVIASVMDLARFDMALMRGALISPRLRDQLFVPGRSPSGAALPYGLGWFLGTYQGQSLAWHTGLWEGRYSALYLKVLSANARHRFTLILLANSDGLTWNSRFDEATIARSPFAMAFLNRVVLPAVKNASVQ